MSGIITEQVPSRPNFINLERFNTSLTNAFFSNPAMVALQINCPGGSAAQSSLIVKRIQQLQRRYEKQYERKIPIVSFVEDMALSGGYYLACAGEEIVCDNNSMVGSIGVIFASFGLEETAKKLGVERRVHTAGKNKAKFDPFLPEDPQDIEKLRLGMDKTHRNFIDVVKHSRGTRLNGDDGLLFNGDFWVGEDAKDLGLVDNVGTIFDYCEEKVGEKVTYRFFRARPAFPAFI